MTETDGVNEGMESAARTATMIAWRFVESAARRREQFLREEQARAEHEARMLSQASQYDASLNPQRPLPPGVWEAEQRRRADFDKALTDRLTAHKADIAQQQNGVDTHAKNLDYAVGVTISNEQRRRTEWSNAAAAYRGGAPAAAALLEGAADAEAGAADKDKHDMRAADAQATASPAAVSEPAAAAHVADEEHASYRHHEATADRLRASGLSEEAKTSALMIDLAHSMRAVDELHGARGASTEDGQSRPTIRRGRARRPQIER